MNLKKQIVIGSLVPSFFILAGCSNEAESVNEIVEEVNTQSTVVIDELNKVTQFEGEVQTAFSETLKSDKELATFADESSLVFENIQNREDGLEEIEVNVETMVEANSNLKEIELREIDTKVITPYVDATESLTASVDNYVEKYKSVLEEERNYFESLSSEDASYQTFSEGIEEINSLHLSLQESYTAIDDRLEEYYTEESNVNKTIDEILKEE